MRISLNNSLAFFCLILVLASSCKQKYSGYVIVGSLSNAEGLKVYLTDRSFIKSKGFKDFIFDSCIVSNGEFQFSGVVNETTVYSIIVEGMKSWKPIIMENTKISFIGSADSLHKSIISGSKENELYRIFGKKVSAINNEIFDLLPQRNLAYRTGDTSNFEKLSAEMRKLSYVRDSFSVQFVKENPYSYVSLLKFPINTTIMDPKELYEMLGENIKQNSHAKRIYNEVNGKLLNLSIGDKAIDFALPDTTGIKVSIFSFKNQYLLIDFWASWCGPCRAETPNLIKAYDQYHDKGFEILGVSLDIERKLWINAINEDKLIWPQVSDLNGTKSPVAKKYGVYAIPMNILLDNQGRVLAIDLHGDELHNYLENLVN